MFYASALFCIDVITSTSNPHIKFARSLARKKERAAHVQFLVEGTRLVREADNAGSTPAFVFFLPSAVEKDPPAQSLLSNLSARTRSVFPVNERVMQTLSETETPQGIAAVYPLPELALPRDLQRVLVLDQLGDPGNVGTILRTAWAADMDAVLLAPDTVDPFNPKVVRAAMGAHFNLPIRSLGWEQIAQVLESVPRIYLADARGDVDFTRADWTPPVALIVGGEAEGVSPQARALATRNVFIPMPGRAESLNAAVAAGILLFASVQEES